MVAKWKLSNCIIEWSSFQVIELNKVWQVGRWDTINLMIGRLGWGELSVLRPRRHYPEKIENAALYLLLGLPSTLIHHENGAFWKLSSIRRNLKTPALRFSTDRKHFENGAPRKRWHHYNHVISLPEFSSNTNLKWHVICSVFKFLQCNADGKHLHWCIFRAQSLWCSVEGSGVCATNQC